MLVNVFSAKVVGIDALPVNVEVDITRGVGIHLVGLADVAVKESLLRTITALTSLGYRIPGKKIVINLAPADIHKKGSGYDLPIAVGILASSMQIDVVDLEGYLMMGELGLDGALRPIPGALPVVDLAAKGGFKACILPVECAIEALEYDGARVYGVRDLKDVIKILADDFDKDSLLIQNLDLSLVEDEQVEAVDEYMDFEDIMGQESAKRGVEIAAAGAHNVLLIGAPGSGKSSLARAMSGILPPMSKEESIQTSKIYSVAGRSLNRRLVRDRPFRAPHCSASVVSLIGGGSDRVLPGEISLAHNGILFLDEFCELSKRSVEVLRGPIEDRKVVISRLKSKVEFPCSFMLLAATNPCPCGYYGEGDRCVCTVSRRLAYLSKLSGPIVDRIDLHLWLHPVNPNKLIHKKKAEATSLVAKRVLAARAVQLQRFKDDGIFTNSQMTGKMIDKYCVLDKQGRDFLERVLDSMGLSARACSRILKISRTIADLDGLPEIGIDHLAEAVGYRFLDKKDKEI